MSANNNEIIFPATSSAVSATSFELNDAAADILLGVIREYRSKQKNAVVDCTLKPVKFGTIVWLRAEELKDLINILASFGATLQKQKLKAE